MNLFMIIGYIILIIIISVVIYFSNKFIIFVLKKNDVRSKKYQKQCLKMSHISHTDIAKYKREKVEFLKLVTPQEIKIFSYGFKLTALLFNNNSCNWVILIHGYRGKKENMLHLAKWYHSKNFNIIIPDLHSCGMSSGKYLGMGYADRLDILNWIKYISYKDSRAKIILHGASIGAASALFTASSKPLHLVGCVSDSSYTDLMGILKKQIKEEYNINSTLFINIMNLIFRLRREGYNLKKANTLNIIKKIDVPILFIHSRDDQLVPISMCDELYNNCISKKEKVIFEGCAHAQSELKYSKLYTEKLEKFLNEIIDCN